ncbi:MAG: GNAT family N-acetyltransferase [Acidimicrobiia bacterium]
MSFATRARAGITRYVDNDRDALRDFQLRMFGPGSRQIDPDRSTWLFDRNPCRLPDGPGLWICRRDGAVVGQQAEIPFELKVGDRTCRAAWAIDLMVDPAWRLRGVGPALVEAQLDVNHIVGGLNISEKGYRAYLRGGWTDLGIVPVYVRPLVARRALSVSPVPERWRRPAAAVATPALAAVGAVHGSLTRLAAARLESIERFDERADDLWEVVAPRYQVLAVRDAPTLRWRWDQRPDRTRHHRFYLVRRGRVVGYAVVRFTAWSDERVALIVDYLVAPGWVVPLFTRVADHARAKGAVAVVCKTLNESADRLLRSMAFRRFQRGPDPPIRFMVRFSDGDEQLRSALSRRRSWLLTAGDSDLEWGTASPAAGGARSDDVRGSDR